jgi:phage terminase large subunit GpA-like protein
MTTENLQFDFPTPLAIMPEEREYIEPRDKLSVSQCAEQRRILSKKESRYAGPWSNNLCPYLVEPMDCLSDSQTREMWMEKCSQSAGTECGHNFLLYTVEEDPSPLLWLDPDEDLCKKQFRTRIKPMFEATPSLLKHLRGNIRNLNVGQETELDNMFLYMGWAGSAVSLSSTPIQKMVLDEAAKFPTEVGREAGPYDLARERMKTFSDISKLFAPSTPILAGDMFDREYQNTDQREYWLKCPLCGQYHIGKFEYIQFDKNSLGHLLPPEHYNDPNCSRYICPNCEKKWDEWNRWQAVTAGIWAPQDCKVEDGKIIGKVFHNPLRGYRISCFMIYPGFINVANIAAKWAKADVAWKSGDKKPRQNFINSWLGECWVEKEKETDTAKLMTHISTHEAGEIPAGVQMLTCGIDVQMDHVWYAVDGWGFRSEVWSIEEGRIETGDVRQLQNYGLIEQLLYRVWNQNLPLSLTGIDCGDWQDQIFDFCAKMQRQGVPIIPVKGSGTGKFDIYTTSKVLGGSLLRYDLNVNNIKNRLYRLMYETSDSGPGYMHLHKDTSPEVLEHLTSEHQVPKKVSLRREVLEWQPKTQHKPNHLWDCHVYAAAAAEIAGVRMLRAIEPAVPNLPNQVSNNRKGFLSGLPNINV